MFRRRVMQCVVGVQLMAWGLLAQAAPLEVSDPWARATVAQQSTSGAFMTLRAQEALRVVAARSPLAAQVEFHEMTLEGDVMRMRARPALVLAAGQTLALQPGSWHLMLIGVAAPLQVGQTVPLWLTIETQAGQRYELAVQAPVRALLAAGHRHDADAHHGHSHEGAGR